MMLIQWCLIFKLIFYRNVEWLWMCTKSGCVKRHNSWKHDLWVPWTRAGSVLALLPTSCVSWGKLPGLLSFPIFICSGTQWMGRYTWLSMQNPLSSCFLANTWTNSLRFGPSLHAEQSGPLRSFRRKILLRLNTIHHDRIVIWNNRFLLLFPPFWIQSNLSSCSWRHLKTYK